MTDMYESLRSVYFPTNAIVTESNSLPWLMMKRISDRLSKESVCAYPDVISFHRFIKNRPLPFISSETDTLSNSSHLVRNSTIAWPCITEERIDRGEVVDAKHLFLRDVAEHGYLVFCCRLERLGNQQSTRDL